MTLDRLALGQDRHRGVVAMQPLGGQNMGLDQRMQRLQRRRAGADLVGQRREAEIDAFAPIALALPVQRLMLAELLEQDHRQQVRPGEAARRHMERRRRLGDRLAVPARELLAHRLDHLPLARDHLQRLGDVLAKLRQPGPSRSRGSSRRGDHDALARQMVGERLARWPPALERADRLRLGRRLLGRQFVLGRGCLQVFQLQLHLLEQPRLALRAAAIKLAPQLLDLELEMGDQRFVAGQIRLSIGRLGFSACAAAASASSRAARSARIIACAAARSEGSDSEASSQADENHIRQRSAKQNRHPTEVGRQVSCGLRQSMPDSR